MKLTSKRQACSVTVICKMYCTFGSVVCCCPNGCPWFILSYPFVMIVLYKLYVSNYITTVALLLKFFKDYLVFLPLIECLPEKCCCRTLSGGKTLLSCCVLIYSFMWYVSHVQQPAFNIVALFSSLDSVVSVQQFPHFLSLSTFHLFQLCEVFLWSFLPYIFSV